MFLYTKICLYEKKNTQSIIRISDKLPKKLKIKPTKLVELCMPTNKICYIGLQY